MKLRLLIWFFCLTMIAAPVQSVFAEELYLEFVQGLRDRNYFDYALLYLDQLAQRPSVPDDIRKLIAYEKAVTLRENARQLRNPEKQFEQLDQALAYLDQFVRENPDHPISGDANADRAQILLQRAEVEIFQSKSPANQGNKSEYQRKGREFVQRARDVLKLAFDQHEAAFKKFPPFIDEQKEPRLHAERAKVEKNMILEALSLAKCTYHEAQTHDSSSREFKQLLNQAADEFEKMFQRYRSQLGGLHARAWQGKCYEEQGDLQKALGIYNELLDHPGKNSLLESIKSQTLQFKLICLAARNDHQLVADLADEWLKDNGSESRTAVGLGIQWEQARALEALGDNRNLPKPEQERFWRQARTTAQQINKYPGEYKDVSLSMMQRVQVKLGGKERKPEDFDAAYGLGRQSFLSALDIKKELDAAGKNQRPAEELTRLKQDWSSELNDALKNLELSMSLIKRSDNQKDVATARLFLAHTNYYMRRNYEAAIYADYVARTATDDDGTVALDAAYMAMAAFHQAYNDNKAEPDRKQDEMRLIIKSANLITKRWPESDKANEARMILGGMYKSAKKPVEAAEWFSKVPESDPKFPEAQIAAGQAYWSAYGSAARLPVESRPTPEKLLEWKSTAETHLRTGIGKLAATLPTEGAVPQELVSAKIYLAEILLGQGKEQDALKLLQDDPQSIIKAITVSDETQRPEKGIQSRSVARSVYTLMLRGYIGLGADSLNNARATMKTLESIASGDRSSDLTDLYVGLGRMLKLELERFRNNGETERFNKLMEAFESFLDDMFKKQEGQSFGSLSWIGETYFALGEIVTDKTKTASYYDRAATAFNGVLTRTQTDANFATTDQLLNVRVRLVRCNRLKKDFERAEQLLSEVLKARGNDLRTQIEGASVFQDWGSNGDIKKLAVAIGGKKEDGLWGWGGIAKRIQQQKNYADRPEMIDTFLDARYNVSLCRFRYSKESAGKEKQKGLETCASELVGSASIFKSLPDDKRAKLNELYREVLQELGKPVTDLPRSDDPPAEKTGSNVPVETTEKPDPVATGKSPQKPNVPETPKPEAGSDSSGSDMITLVVFVLLALAGVGAIGWVIVKGGKPKRKLQTTRTKSLETRTGETKTPSAKSGELPLTFAGIATEKESAALAPRPRPRPVQATGVPATGAPSTGTKATGSPGTAPAAPKPAPRPQPRPEGETGAVPRPRPRPPSPPKEE